MDFFWVENEVKNEIKNTIKNEIKNKVHFDPKKLGWQQISLPNSASHNFPNEVLVAEVDNLKIC